MNKFKKSLALVLALGMVLAITACQDSKAGEVKEGVKATVNDTVITKEEFEQHLSVSKKMDEVQYGPNAWTEEKTEKLLDQLILEVLLEKAAEKEGITVTEEAVNSEIDYIKTYMSTEEEYKAFLEGYGMTEEYFMDSLKREILRNNYVNVKMEQVNPSDEELEKLFDDWKMKEEVSAKHILVKTEDEAKAVIDRANKGESFEDLAKELSVDTASGAVGGDLGYFSYIRMVKPFSDAAFALEIGEISEPVKSEFGYHIIKLTDKKTDDAKTLETEKPIMTEYYKYMKYDELLVNIVKEADITK